MAALTDPHAPAIVDLRQIRGADLDPLLNEETETWREMLEWDFHPSAGLVRRFLDMQSLTGYALLMAGRVAGYSYFVAEERKGLIGDLYVMEEFATPDVEAHLLHTVLDGMVKSPFVHRIESQLMMLRHGSRIALPYWRYLKVHLRDFLEIDLAKAQALPQGAAARAVTIDNWSERKQDEAAQLIATAYQGHVDSDINDQYRSPAGARRFLMNIVQYPGCGAFFQPASYVALDARTGHLCGICLSSLVAEEIGHITQVCVSKAVRGHGVGYELLRRSLEALARNNCKRVSLTVTSANRSAIDVYLRMGFTKRRDFSAYVWDGF
jgi:ribosomal protein S18 acetylase RimI-like enzyme